MSNVAFMSKNRNKAGTYFCFLLHIRDRCFKKVFAFTEKILHHTAEFIHISEPQSASDTSVTQQNLQMKLKQVHEHGLVPKSLLQQPSTPPGTPCPTQQRCSRLQHAQFEANEDHLNEDVAPSSTYYKVDFS